MAINSSAVELTRQLVHHDTVFCKPQAVVTSGVADDLRQAALKY
jgi:hypothetical protein